VLFSTLLVVLVFFLVRFLGVRYLGNSTQGNYAGGVAAVAFALGFLSYAVFVLPSQSVPAAAPASSNGATEAVGAAVVPKKIVLDDAAVSHLVSAKGGAAIGNLDILSTKPNELNNESKIFPANSEMFASGWVADGRIKAPVNGVVFIIDSARVINGTNLYGQSRPDLVKGYKTEAMLMSGFNNVRISTSGLRKGAHSIQLAALFEDVKHFVPVGAPRQFMVK